MRRMRRIFSADDKSVIIAMDHGMGLTVSPFFDDTGSVIEKVIEGGADAILTTYGIAKRYAKELENTGLILRIDGGGSELRKDSGFPRLLYSVEEALKIGADAIVIMGFPGIDMEEENMESFALVAAQCREWGVPLVAEMLPGGFANDIPNSVENIALASRIGCEYGADIIKTSFAGSKEEFKKVIDGSFVPVVVLGGEKTKNLEDLFLTIEDAMDAGAKGVAIGRNVCKHAHPDLVTKVLVDIVHGGKSAQEAMKRLK